jgi:TRAP-type mannitol/chloroaromatic compound transport system permease large subunit
MDTLLIMGTFFGLLALGLPVAYTLGLTALIGAVYFTGDMSFCRSSCSRWATASINSALLAIPFFVLAGAIMAEGGIAARLINFASIFVGFIRGGLSLVNILASTFFGAISGSSVADTASIGSVMIPQMEKHGYPRRIRGCGYCGRFGAGHSDSSQPQCGDLFLVCQRRFDWRACSWRAWFPAC